MDLGRMPNRDFVWDIIFSVIPSWGNQYCDEVMAQRFAKPEKIFDDSKIIKVSDEWMEKLKFYDFKSKICT